MNSLVVSLDEVESGIARVTMHDRKTKNGFSPELMLGLMEAFEEIACHPEWRVVILTGYENYFSSGGTQQVLMSLQEGKGTFADVNVYSLALDCPIPVISAMQGHAIGGGFVMGLYADFVLLSRESVYTTNFMRYGFTPGMGATYITVQKLGLGLAQEMLIAADTFRGEALQKRGVPFPVLPRAEIADRALELARTVASKPRGALVALKSHLVSGLRETLPGVIRQEVAMHESSFRDAAVKDRIMNLFGT